MIDFPGQGGVCDYNGVFMFQKDGTVTSGMDGSCVTVEAVGVAGSPVGMAKCDGKAHQVFETTPSDNGVTGGLYIKQGTLCVDNNWIP